MEQVKNFECFGFERIKRILLVSLWCMKLECKALLEIHALVLWHSFGLLGKIFFVPLEIDMWPIFGGEVFVYFIEAVYRDIEKVVQFELVNTLLIVPILFMVHLSLQVMRL